MKYTVIQCCNCGHFIICRYGQFWKRCPYCNELLQLNPVKIRIIKHCESLDEARYIKHVLEREFFLKQKA